MSTPYADHAAGLRAAGWLGVLPLPPGEKLSPPTGFTGRAGRWPTDEEVERWAEQRPGANIALRVPLGVVGIDLDVYKGEAELWRRLTEEWGPLPLAPRSSSRTDGSGILLFRVAEDVELRNDIAGIDCIVQHHHRYLVAPGSIHPSGAEYRAHDLNGSGWPCRVDELPWLPQRWVDGLTVGAGGATSPSALSVATAPTSEWSAEVKAAAMDGIAVLAPDRGVSRHTAALAPSQRLARLEALGHPGATEALDMLGRAFVAAVEDRSREAEAEAEWDRMVEGGRTNAEDPDGPTFEELEEQKHPERLIAPERSATVWPVWPSEPSFPDPPNDWAYYGLVGDVVEAYDGLHEGSPVAVAVQFLAAYNNAVGHGPYIQVGGDRHHANLFVALVGPTSSGRKGTSASVALYPMQRADEHWYRHCRAGGLYTAEGLISRVRDPKVNAKGEVTDEGITDKRLFLLETEAGTYLKRAASEGNTLTGVLRQAWDGEALGTLIKNSPDRATGAHVSLIVHTTPEDLREHLAHADILNGFANRHLWVAARSTVEVPLPRPLPADVSTRLAGEILRRLAETRRTGRVALDDAAEDLWRANYGWLRTNRPTGALGAATERAAPQVLRLALGYCLTDAANAITANHLTAAMALWEYCERSAAWIFGLSTGDRTADLLLAIMRDEYPEPMTLTAARQELGRTRDLRRQFRLLVSLGLAEQVEIRNPARGRPAHGWLAAPPPGFTAY